VKASSFSRQNEDALPVGVISAVELMAVGNLTMFQGRVTRLGEFSPIRSLLTLGIFEMLHNFWLLYSTIQFTYVPILTKMGEAKVWAIFHKLIWSPCSRILIVTRVMSEKENVGVGS
jgi:hypothetical protein